MPSVILLVAMATLFAYVNSGQNELQIFCTILNQSLPDLNQCFEKPSTYTIGVGDNFILAYLCCENYFTDVTYDYIKYLNSTFLQYQAGLTDEVILIDHAKFIKMCYPGLNGYLLTKEDYLNWSSNGRTADRCRV